MSRADKVHAARGRQMAELREKLARAEGRASYLEAAIWAAYARLQRQDIEKALEGLDAVANMLSGIES